MKVNFCEKHGNQSHLHVVSPAPAPDLAGDVSRSGGGDEVVVLAGLELQTRRRRRERPEGDGEQPLGHRARRAVVSDPVANRHLRREIRVADPARLVVVTVDVVDYVPGICTKF